jgi:DNA primase
MFTKRFSPVDRQAIVEKAHQCVWTESGRPGLEYLTSKRGLSEQVIKDFQLGYMPDFVNHQLKGRIIFPIHDPSGNLIVVSSRALHKDEHLPVYWHESYEKSFYLYGMHLAKQDMRRLNYVIVVEGQFDVLQVNNHGIKNVVALCGTKMSDMQISVIRRYCEKIVLVLDTDENESGQQGAQKIVKASICSVPDMNWSQLGVSPMFREREPTDPLTRQIVNIQLPERIDPDEFLLKYGVDKFKKVLNNTYARH